MTGNNLKIFLNFMMVYSISHFMLFLTFFCYLYLTLPEVNYLKTTNPHSTSLMHFRAKQQQKTFSESAIEFEWVVLKEIPEMLRRCVVLSEDASFWVHEGIDWFEIKESFLKNIQTGMVSRGGSTITQQVAKNLFLSPRKSIKRKIREWMISKKIEANLSKNRILEIYLNIAEWGPDIYGIKAASEIYFQEAPSRLSLNQMIQLAAVLPNPFHLKPNQYSKELIWRSKIILDRLKRYKYIDQTQFDFLSQFYDNAPEI
jgi:monofunctional biosynthetic peptidoglycan transglycosylase